MNRSNGFTLAELAVALVIVGLLLAGALIPLSTQIEVRNVSDTRRTMDGIKEAIIGFAQANGRLPCPADGSKADGISGAGTEQYNGTSCTATFGVVPWSTLGAPETDAWGRRFSYRVSPIFADAITASTWVTSTTTTPASPGNQPTTNCAPPTPVPSLSTFALCSLGDIAVLTRSESATAATLLGTALPAVIISHGKNGYSAWQTNGMRLMPAPSGGDEFANANGTTSATGTALGGGSYASWVFYSRNPMPASSGCSDPAPGAAASSAPLCELDDIVVMISSNFLIARMVSAGRLP
jgi:prepilin-type N-terminal cleavage/methylation domain-containing protein